MTGTQVRVAENEDLIVLATSSAHLDAPEFSICVPQFNRTSFLIEACSSLAGQGFRSFEICISDDCSTDGREGEVTAFLEASGMDFVYARQKHNRRYDGNLRGAISLARGKYVFLLGNDDRLADTGTLGHIHELLLQASPVQVALTNYASYGSGQQFRRVSRGGVLGSGPAVAARTFRDFAFVSGVIFDAAAARQWATDRWDGSEMYQMFLACRILAAGGKLLGIADVCIEKDIQIAGESVDSYAVIRVKKDNFSPVSLPMAQIAPLVTDAIAPYVSRAELNRAAMRIVTQLLIFTYAYWLVEFRRVQSWRYAVSVYRGLSPKRILKGTRTGWRERSLLTLLYVAVGLSGLALPVRLFGWLEPILYRIAKRRASTGPVPTA